MHIVFSLLLITRLLINPNFAASELLGLNSYTIVITFYFGNIVVRNTFSSMLLIWTYFLVDAMRTIFMSLGHIFIVLICTTVIAQRATVDQVVAYSNNGDANVSLLSNNMVLQRDSDHTKFWGAAGKHGEVIIQIFSGDTLIDRYQELTLPKNYWVVHLKPMKAGGPYTITVQTPSAQFNYSNVLFGDVFLCSGQSNSTFTI
jgi:hypothetical protein